MAADLLSRLSPGVLEMLAGTPLEHAVDKLEQLGRVVLEEQAAVVRRHLIFEIPWEAAFEGLTLRSDVEGPEAAHAAPESEPVEVRRRIERRRVSDLKPNRFNAALFPDSLADTSIAVIADDLQRNGQRTAVEITPDGTIIDGERRWRGATQLGWDDVEVLVGPELTDDEILDCVLDSCTSSRQMTVREQVNVFKAVTDQLRRDVGRQQGRPSGKTFQKGNVFLTPRDVRSTAAKRAGFSSPSLALRAEAIFTRGSTELQANVLDGALAITAAYDALPKRTTRKKATAPTPTPSDANDGGANGAPGADLPESNPPPEIAPPDLASSATPPVENVRRDRGDTDDAAREGATSPTFEPEPEPEEEPEQPPEDEEELADPPRIIVNDEEEEPTDIAQHVNAICTHVIRLAEHDYDEAVMWLDDAVEQMRASLGDRPDSDEVEHEDDQFDEFDELLDS